MTHDLSHLDLFSGIGGFSIGFEQAGFRTLAFSEVDPEACATLASQWPNVRNLGDVRNIFRFADEYPACDNCGEPYCERHGRHYADCQCIGPSQFADEIGWPLVVTGGVPCQPASLVGKRRGTADERWMWPEAIRIVDGIRPRFALFENPPAILTLEDGEAFAGITSALVACGYDLWWDVLPAYAVGAGHRRERLLLLASHSHSAGLEGHAGNGEGQWQAQANRHFAAPDLRARKLTSPKWYAQSGIQPVVNGLSSRLARAALRCIGNAVVPQVPNIFAHSIAQYLNHVKTS